MARSMFSRGMLAALASAMIVRRRGFMPGSPPPCRAATVSSLMRRVKTLPRLASAAPFLCLMVCHLEWPDMQRTPTDEETVKDPIVYQGYGGPYPETSSSLLREDNPRFGPLVPGAAAVVAEQGRDRQAGGLEAAGHLPDGEGAKRERDPLAANFEALTLDELLVEDREPAGAILADGLDQRDPRAVGAPPTQARPLRVFLPRREVGDE